MFYNGLCVVCLLLIALSGGPLFANDTVRLERVGTTECVTAPCTAHDAIVFVHGIYGSAETFKNGDFDWPEQFPRTLENRSVDVYLLLYESALLSWAGGSNPQFDDVVEEVIVALEKIRRIRYRSIGFIAHSLGGNVISSYLHAIKAQYGHPQRSQHGFLITLGTPVQGAHIANIGILIKSALGIKDDLLKSLEADNLYLRMLQRFRTKTNSKSTRYGCRPVLLYIGYELEGIGPIKVVPTWSAVQEDVNNATRRIKGFDVNHSEIAKPQSLNDEVHVWVMENIVDTYQMLDEWATRPEVQEADHRLCQFIPFVDEQDFTGLHLRDWEYKIQ